MKRYKLIKKGKKLCTITSVILCTAIGLAILPSNVKADAGTSTETTSKVQTGIQQESNLKSASLNCDSQTNNVLQVKQNKDELSAVSLQSSLVQNGWQKSDNNLYYYQNGPKLTGQQILNGITILIVKANSKRTIFNAK
ncbi:hypothetical protein H5S09_08030 [Limosilactobacillus sp. STM2_1]|uniref:Uncharacterized protein n=1 Tax=Limosilactobacillus rudii TaxID=2759755 RepID=A0A7W3ULQ1_9LACO|nr:hypothetical protein [Limosilactobacillus rudii]MBB1079804.1 hypothetical protein [Limosilactobacillus rudii]MBB1097882.1 hypothetical protein [Limosilactobacillus rudii]MCD7134964.1 hypothetical protein [Limosilactobacillus rudii]